MTYMSPIHSEKQPVHHNNNKCTEANNIESRYLRQGTGGKPLCKNCADLNRQGK